MDAKFQFCETQMRRTVRHNLVWKHGNVLQWRVNFITRIILEAKSYKIGNYNPMHFAPGDTLYNFDWLFFLEENFNLKWKIQLLRNLKMIIQTVATSLEMGYWHFSFFNCVSLFPSLDRMSSYHLQISEYGNSMKLNVFILIHLKLYT